MNTCECHGASECPAKTAPSKTAAVVIDDWKLPTFKKHLDAAGYEYSQAGALAPGVLTLHVKYEWVAKLKPVIEAAMRECAKLKGPQE